MKKHKGIFITFEGGEGVGKSTILKLVEKELTSLNKNVFLTREPGGTGLPFAEQVRKIIMKYYDMDPITELLLFNASRREHLVQIILPNLKKGKIVISDRFSDSTFIYQGVVKGIKLDYINKANDLTVGKDGPELVFIFDLDPKIGMERIVLANKSNTRKVNRFDIEGKEFHEKVRKGYLNLSKTDKQKYILVDASKNPQEIANKIVEKIIDYGNSSK